MNVDDIATLVTAGFAAVAAGASWATVAQTRRDRIKAQTPLMSIDVVLPPDEARVLIQIVNHGPAARQVEFAVATDGQCTQTVTEKPTFAPGEMREYDSGIQRQTLNDPASFVSCYDLTGGILHVWYPTGDHLVYRPRDRPDERPSRADLMRHIAPGFDPARMQMVRPARMN